MFFSKKSDKKIITADATSGQIEEKIESSVDIYTIPKRFLGMKPSGNKAKSQGLVVLLLGIMFLIALVIFFYFYFTSGIPGLNKEPALNNNVQPPTPIDRNLNSQDDENNDSNKPAEIVATSTISDLATSSDFSVNATTSTDMDATSSPSDTSAETLASTTESVTKNILPMASDTDGDGLTDAEEVVFATDPNKRDSDGDEFEDLAEIKNLYNPAGTGKLLANSSFDLYSNTPLGFSLYVPKQWPAKDNPENNSVIFMINENTREFIEIIKQDNTGNQLIEDWYKQYLNKSFISQSQFLFKKGWTGVKSEDGLNAYLLDPLGKKIFILSYNTGDSTSLNYKNIFDMMIESLKD